MKKKKVLITGTAGFICGNYVRRLIYLCNKNPEKYNYYISSIDMVKSNTINAIYNNKNHSFHIANLLDKHVLDIIFQFEKPDIVIHGAANIDMSDSLSNHVDNNVIASQNIVDSCIKYNVGRIIYIDSYKEVNLNDSNYDITKALGRKVILDARNSGINSSAIGLPKVYGPRQHRGELIPNTINKLMNNEEILVDNEVRHEWMHIFDICSGITEIVKNGKSNYNYYLSNSEIDGGQRYTEYEIVAAVAKYMAADSNLYGIQNNPDSISNSLINVEDFKSTYNLDWEQIMSMTSSIGPECVQWYLKNSWFLK